MEGVWRGLLSIVFVVVSVGGTDHHGYPSSQAACFRTEPCEPASLLADTSNCRKYWLCLESREWVVRECEDHGRFDHVLRICVHTGNQTCHPGCLNMTCPLTLSCQPGAILPDPQDCQRFHQCGDNGESWKSRNCPDGTQFDHLTSRCSSRARCAQNCLPASPGMPLLTNNTKPSDSSGTTSVIVDPCELPSPCQPGTITADTFICSRYLQCSSSGRWTLIACPGGGDFDYKKGSCVDAGTAACYPVCSRDLHCVREEPCDLSAIVPDPFNCQSFYQCDTSLRWVRLSCSLNLYFDMRFRVCVEKSAVVCHPECIIDPCGPLPDQCPKAGIRVPQVQDCAAYYECPERDGNWLIKHCDSGERFDYITKECGQGSVCHPGCGFNRTTTDIIPTTDFATTTGPYFIEVTNHTLVQVTPEALEGHKAEFLCQVVTNPAGVANGQLMWYLHGLRMSAGGRRFDINDTREEGIYQSTWSSTLLINPVGSSDIGVVNCSFEGGAGELYTDRGLYLDVLLRPLVSVSALSSSVPRGGTLSISYFISQPIGGGTSLKWYKDDDILTENDNEKITQVSENEYRLDVKEVERDVTYGCVAVNRAGESDKATCEVAVADKGEPTCRSEIKQGVPWPMTVPGHTTKQDCPGNATGIAMRFCSGADGEAKWEDPNMNHCVDVEYQEVVLQVSDLEDGLGIESQEAVTTVAQQLEVLTNSSIYIQNVMKPGNLNVTVSSVQKLANIHQMKGASQAAEPEIVSIVQTASNVLAEANLDSWQSVLREDQYSGVSVMSALDRYSGYLAKLLIQGGFKSTSLNNLDQEKNIKSDNLVLSSGQWTEGNLTYPSRRVDWTTGWTQDKAVITEQTLTSIAEALGRKDLLVSNTYYRTLHQVLPVESTDQLLPTRIMTISIDGLPAGMHFDTPIHLQFTNEMEVNEKDQRTCSFWDYTSPTSGTWSGKGCHLAYADGNITRCEVDHLTNFAILVTRYRPGGDHQQVLSILTIVGLSLSIVCMLVTIIIYGLLWKTIKSDYALMLMNICGALIVANFVFLVGIRQTQIQVLCAVIAAVLHYLFLAAFFLMLAEAVELLLYVVYVFHVHTPKETTALLFAAWGIPLVIVGISLGITKGHGYGNDEFCWLTLERGVIWAFLGPMIGIILSNFVMLGIVLKTLLGSSKLRNEKQSDRIRSAAWNVLILSPTLGLSWTFGLFAINENTLVFQYIFTSLNAFQGLFIFVFHCLLNKRIRDAFNDKYIKDKSMSFSSSSSGALKSRIRKGSLASKSMTNETQLGTSRSFRLKPLGHHLADNSPQDGLKPDRGKTKEIDPGEQNTSNGCADMTNSQTPKRNDKIGVTHDFPDKDESTGNVSYENITFQQEYRSVRV